MRANAASLDLLRLQIVATIGIHATIAIRI